MIRKKQVRGLCCLCFGFGILAGYRLESWFWCCLFGLGLMVLGAMLAGKRC